MLNVDELLNNYKVLDSIEEKLKTGSSCWKPIRCGIARQALADASKVLNSIKHAYFAPDIEVSQIYLLKGKIQKICMLTHRHGAIVKQARKRLNQKIRNINQLYYKLSSQSTEPDLASKRLAKLPGILPAYYLFDKNAIIPEKWKFLSHFNLNVILNLDCDEIIERCFVNSGLRTANDLFELFQKNISTSKNILQILSDHFANGQKIAKAQMTETQSKEFEWQWDKFSKPVEAWDFLSNIRLNNQLATELALFKRIGLYRSVKLDYILLVNIKTQEEAALFQEQFKGEKWYCYWTENLTTFYPNNSVSFTQITAYLRLCDHKRQRTLGFYEREELDVTTALYKKIEAKQIRFETNELRIWNFHKVSTLQELIVGKLFYNIS